MKAAIWYGPGRIEVETVPDPIPGPADLLLKIICCNICGSDLRTYLSGSSSIKPGTILGHEFAGQVVSAPEGSGFSPGDVVTAAQDINCGDCGYCRHGLEHICQNKLEFGKHFPGAFAELMVVPETALAKGWVRKLPPGMTPEEASLVEPASSCVHTLAITPRRPGQAVLIIGAGPIGCLHGELAKAAGAGLVLLADTAEDRLNMAERFGFDACLNARQTEFREQVFRLCPGGVDLAISANPSPAAIIQAIDLVRKAGIVVAFGGLPKGDPWLTIDGNRIHYDEIVLMGSYAYSRRENDEALARILKRDIHPELYITDVLPLDSIREGFERARAGRALKLQIRP
ncbi:MAG TPA: alcohol dehydrogenase catalytic domain-containing protein [Bacillota bacterium]